MHSESYPLADLGGGGGGGGGGGLSLEIIFMSNGILQPP